jgi:hypothetical protein
MKDEDLLRKLWRLQSLMAEIESKSGEVANQLGFKGVHQTVYDYIRGVEYDHAMQAFSTLTTEMQKQFILDAQNIYEGETT